MLLKSPGNGSCADCGGRYPRFASINLAVFLCNRCYGIHRSMGTHITRTKTVGLDRWSSEEVHRMRSIGNTVANSYWEENAPPIFQRPNADSPDFEVEKYIRDKYERKLFCSPDKEPPSIPPQVAEPVNLVASNKIPSPQVKLLPRGAIRCGPNCLSPSNESSSSGARTTTPDDFRPKPSCPGSSLYRTSGSAETLPDLLNSQSSIGLAFAITDGKQQPGSVDDDDEEFGDFVQG